MSYRTILVHVDKSANAAERFRVAADLAGREGAHLVGTAMSGVPRYLYSGSMFEGSGVIIRDFLEHARKRADEALAQFRQVTAGFASCEVRRREEDEYSGLGLQARYADLVVLGQANPEERGEGALPLDLPENVAVNSGRPVLVVPYAGEFRSLGKHPMIAWNGSVEAARAVTAALPLLRRATNVTVAIFDPEPGTASHGQEPGADIALYLARHGVEVEVTVCPGPIDIGNAILSTGANIDADLLVMGCYGHSRFREMMLGGASRTVLSSMTLPVLLAH